MENNPKKEPLTIGKISFSCSLIAMAICLIFMLFEWWNYNLIDNIWVILLIANACILFANWKLK